MRISREDTVALIVDYQEKLMPVMRESEHLLKCTSILLEGLGVLNIPMYVTQQYTKGLGETVMPIRQAMKVDEQDWQYIEKIRFSSFEDVKHLIEGKKYVIVCGIEAHICVLQTVIDLAQGGYIPVLVVDCISSRKELDYTFALERAKAEGAILTTYESILFEVLQVAGTEESKKIQKLIK